MYLNSLAFGTSKTDFNSQFNQQLQFITDMFTNSNMEPLKPNGSAINQVRTDELAFDPSDPDVNPGDPPPEWELREHKLTCTGGPPCNDALLNRVPVTLTPANSFGWDNNVNSNPSNLPTTTLSDFLTDTTFGPQITAESHDIPLTYNGVAFLGGSSRQGRFSFESQAWVNTPPPFGTTFFPGNLTVRTRRRLLGLSTCNGCHYNETTTPEMHVAPRDYDVFSTVSPFLNISQTSVTNYSAVDPLGTTTKYNEPRRRICELLWLNDGNVTRLTTNAGRPH
jgi:hypothetical protein